MPPLYVAALGWTLVVLGAPGSGAVTVGIDAVGWSAVAYGWHRMVAVERSFGRARWVALAGVLASLARLLPAPSALVTAVNLAAVMLVVLALALGADALLACARAGGSPLVSGQASFLRWAAVGLLILECVGAVGYLWAPMLDGLVLAAALMGLLFGCWFALLQLLGARRSWASPASRR